MKSIVKKQHANSGFALVVTLSLMILLTVIAVGLLSLSAISLRSSSTSEADARAFANARLSIMMAIGELQKEVGDDRRITADASIVKDPNDVSQNHLVGSWSSWSPRYSAQPDQQPPNYAEKKTTNFRKWLVSAPDPSVLEDRDWAISKAAPNWIKLFSVAGDGFDLRGAPVLTPRGTLAWVVTQENTKAKINVAGPDNNQTSINLALQVQPRPSLALSNFLKQPASGWNERANRVLSMNQVKLDTELTADPATANAAAASYTAHASGLLTDVVNGGLKTDLNLGFEMEDQEFEKASWGSTPNPFRSPNPSLGFTSPNSFQGQQALFRPLVENPIVAIETDYSPATVAQRFYGAGVPTFDHLRSFYRIPYHLYGGSKPVVAERGTDHVGIKIPPKSAGSFFAPSSPPPGQGSTLAIRPVLNRMIYILSTQLDSTNKVRLVITPIISLWNPYNIALDVEGAVAYPWIDIPFNLTWEFKTGQNVRKEHAYMSNMMGKQFQKVNHGRSVDPYFLCELTANGDGDIKSPIRFEPGEVRVFSPVSTAPKDFLLMGKNADRTVRMRALTDAAALNAKGGLSVPMTGFDSTVTPATSVRLTVSQVQDGQPYNYFVTLEDAARIKNPDDATRGQAVSDVQMLNFSSYVTEIKSPYLSYGALQIGGQLFGVLETYHRTAKQNVGGQATADLVYTTNPRQASINSELAAGNFEVAPHFQSSLRAIKSANDAIRISPEGNSYWGWTNSSQGDAYLPFFEIPREPLLSLAAFQHADLASSAFSSANQFANSFASPYMAASSVGKVNKDKVSSGVPIYDHSYLTNEALWDRFFFSGAAPRMSPAANGAAATAWKSPIAKIVRSLDEVVEEFVADPVNKPLSNSRMRLVKDGLSDKDLAKRLLDPAGCTRIAGHLMVDGAFNVNSTDLEAWVAVLSGLRGQPFKVEDGSPPASSLTAFPRFRHPTGETNDNWNGFRALNDSQIRTLAENLVEEIRLRGPFLSLAEFVNRRVEDGALGNNGAIQAAIDAGKFNVGADQDTFAVDAYPQEAQSHIINNTGVGIPGYLTQADTLQSLAPVITCRSDTFTIRGYGEAKDASGKVIARARCEAVVQRMPHFVDPSDSPDAAIASVTPVNQAFGRRFEIISFRRISSAEVQ